MLHKLNTTILVFILCCLLFGCKQQHAAVATQTKADAKVAALSAPEAKQKILEMIDATITTSAPAITSVEGWQQPVVFENRLAVTAVMKFTDGYYLSGSSKVNGHCADLPSSVERGYAKCTRIAVNPRQVAPFLRNEKMTRFTIDATEAQFTQWIEQTTNAQAMRQPFSHKHVLIVALNTNTPSVGLGIIFYNSDAEEWEKVSITSIPGMTTDIVLALDQQRGYKVISGTSAEAVFEKSYRLDNDCPRGNRHKFSNVVRELIDETSGKLHPLDFADPTSTLSGLPPRPEPAPY